MNWLGRLRYKRIVVSARKGLTYVCPHCGERVMRTIMYRQRFAGGGYVQADPCGCWLTPDDGFGMLRKAEENRDALREVWRQGPLEN